MPRGSKGITFKYLVVGDSGVGKTSLLVRYCEDTFGTEYLSTIGVDFKIKRIECNDSFITLNIWDTAGQERFRNITKSFYKGAHGIVVAYSVTDPPSLEHVENWVEQIRESSNEKMMMMLVGTKTDLTNERKVSTAQGKELADRYDMEFVEVSAKENHRVSEVFETLTRSLLASGAIETNKNDGKIVPLCDKSSKSNQPNCCM